MAGLGRAWAGQQGRAGQGRVGLENTKSRWAAGIYGKLRQEYNGWRHPADFVPAVSDEVGPRTGNQQPSGLQCVLLVISSLTFVTFMTFKPFKLRCGK